ncbi:MAG TPA: sugar ABC transporter permease [candidate division Zixibacteria bacterium]|jgi:multiple sugar transport system permease protein|nr:sugar ABC transporter permease [candidate division Zixibacteria bacterium]
MKAPKNINTAWFFLLPVLAVMAVFRLLPMSYAVAMSFFDWGLAGARRFMGLWNYFNLLADSKFLQSLVNTVYYVMGAVPASLFIALFVAILLNQKLRLSSAYRLALFLPVITSTVAVSLVWKWIFNPRMGVANQFLSWTGLGPSMWLEESAGIANIALAPLGLQLPGFLAGPSLAMCAIIIMSVWHHLGYNVIIFLAGLQSIPRDYYEAASLDGAGRWHAFRNVTWPLLSPTTFYVLIMTSITSFQMFIQVYTMQGPIGGSPMGTTRTLVYYLYEKGFSDWQMGYANAIAFVLFLIVLGLTLLQRRVLEKRVHYQ